jgi:hypothetical protein
MTGQKQARDTRCLSQPGSIPVHIREKTGKPGAYEIERKQANAPCSELRHTTYNQEKTMAKYWETQ